MHCDRAVATMESYIGLVEAGRGIIAGGWRLQGTGPASITKLKRR